MKNYLVKWLIGISILSTLVCFTGCNQQPEQLSADASTTASPAADEASLSLIITIINHCGTDIGMFSVIDPRTQEQIDLGGIGVDEAITMPTNWPKECEHFQWALYNQNGDLSVEGNTDISAAKSAVTLTLIGDGDLTDVEESFE